MRIAIAGDGIAGRTLYHLLKRNGFEVVLYGLEKQTKCNIRPCGFGTSGSCLQLMKRLDFSPETYVLCSMDYITMDGFKIKGDIYGIDKPKLIGAIAVEIRYGVPDVDNYDLIVDATGFARAYSPPIPQFRDKQAINYQHKVILKNDISLTFDNIRGGYTWVIPLGDNEVHVGGGSFILPSNEVKQLVLHRVEMLNPDKIICSCSEPLRLSGPVFPLVNGKVVTIGESAGLVIPFGAAGIHTAFESAIILSNSIKRGDIQGYDGAIRKQFAWICNARRILDSLEEGKINFFSLGTAFKALRYQGLRVTLMDLLQIRRKLLMANS